MGSPSSVFIDSGDRDYVVLIRDVFHFEQKDAASGGPQHDQIRMCVNGARMDADVLKSSNVTGVRIPDVNCWAW